MYINGYGSWGNCSDIHYKTNIFNRISPWYTNDFKTHSYGYIDDGHFLYSRNKPCSIDVFDYSKLENNNNIIKVQGKTYPDRVVNFVSQCFPKFKLKPVISIKGWCSWNTYFQYLSPDKIQIQISYAKNIQHDIDPNFKYILIDFGYSNVGDIVVNDNQWVFKTIENIKSQGLIPGIWINPFSSIYKFKYNTQIKSKYKRMFLKTVAHNSNKILPLYLMSIHDYRYQELLINKIKYLYDQGIRLFKFDFNIFLFWQEEKYSDILKMYKEFYSNVKNIVPEAILIGCGVPLFDSVGIFDYVRVTKDSLITPFAPKKIWKYLQSIRKQDIMQSIIVRKPFNGLLWHADYDQINNIEKYKKSRDRIKIAGFDLNNFLGKGTKIIHTI